MSMDGLSLELGMHARENFLMATEGVEVLKNIRKANDEDLAFDIDTFLEHLKYAEFAVAEASGPSGTGKGSLLGGLRRILYNPETVDYLTEDGSTLEVNPIPFALCTVASRFIRDIPPEFWVDPEKTQANFTWEDQSKFSGLQWWLYKKYVFERRKKGKIQVTLNEGGGILAIPTKVYEEPTEEVPEMLGELDTGMSTFSRYAAHPGTYENTWAYLFNRAECPPINEVLKYRNPNIVYKGQIKEVVTLADGNEVETKELPPKVKKAIQLFKQFCMATTVGIPRFNGLLDKFENDLYTEGTICQPSDQALNELIASRLPLLEDRLSIISSESFNGPKTYDLMYYLDSLVLRLFPSLFKFSLQGHPELAGVEKILRYNPKTRRNELFV